MLKLSPAEMIKKIRNLETFTAISSDGAFLLSLEAYMPYLCVAVHNGGNLRATLREKIALSKQERWYEEDPFTGQFISSLPIKMVAYDSRYEYDLNRSPDLCIYEEAWGKQVWKTPLTPDEKSISLHKHDNFYRVLYALVKALNNQFKACIVYDIHSYNYKRYENHEELPLFNLGTEKLDTVKFDKPIKQWIRELKKIKLPGVHTKAEINKVFYGRGYALEFITKNFPQTLVLPTEIKKVYIDEENGDEYPEIIESLEKSLKIAIVNHAYSYAKALPTVNISKKHEILSQGLDDSLKIVDGELHSMLKKLELLENVNPTNIESEKKKFFASRFRTPPKFKYKPLSIDTNELRRELYRLPLDKIKDIHLKWLFEEIIDYKASRLDLLALRDSEEFLFASLKNYGKPSDDDINNAKFLLYIKDNPDDSPLLDSRQTADLIKESVDRYGFKCHLELVKNLASTAMVVNSTKTLKLRKEARFNEQFAHALACHEIGVHMLTTMNALKQPLRFLRSGIPGSTVTQEGMAILAEYLSGYMGISRLQELALRVVAVDSMIRDYSFITTFDMLVDKYNTDPEKAFYLTTRVYRGGGFTKDYLYLTGFHQMLTHYLSGEDFTCLFVGKTSLKYKSLFIELIERKIIHPPHYIPDIFLINKQEDPVLTHLVNCLR